MNELLKEFNRQYYYEIESEYIYLTLSGYFAKHYKGFSNFFIVQAHEERLHAMKFFLYLTNKEVRPELKSIKLDNIDENLSVLDALEIGLDHEKFISNRINFLMELAKKENDKEAINFLKWYVAEQQEEEELFLDLIKAITDKHEKYETLNQMLAARTMKYRIISPTTNNEEFLSI